MNVAVETPHLTRDFGAFRAVNQLSLRVPTGARARCSPPRP